jgi:ATP-dependent DNA helicase DinG
VNAMELFPLDQPRGSQVQVITEIEKAYANGYRFAIIEAPVGSGKSAIAITFARLFGSSHIITPRKSLQNQYFEDFEEHVVLMKGRAAYPCTYEYSPNQYRVVIKAIEAGFIQDPGKSEQHCGNAPCIEDRQIYKSCTSERDCPYHVAIDVAGESESIIHNLHSFIFQTSFAKRFQERGILIIDEAHEIENHVREFISKKITLPKYFLPEEQPSGFKYIDEWVDWFQQGSITSLFSDKIPKPGDSSDRQKFIDRLEVLKSYNKIYDTDFVVKREADITFRKTKFTFVPSNIGNAAHTFLFNFGKKVMLMSGTIYNKDVFCRNLGINRDEAYFIRVDSSFPVESRPIYLKEEYMVNTSHAQWEQNFPKLIEVLKALLAKFPDAKGLIHSPSYAAGLQIVNAMKDKRLVYHERDNFLSKLDKFFESKDNKVFVSPTCQQGVDFKDDRARFQVIIRVPYPNTNDLFIQHKLKRDFPWYNYQSLVTFGQQIGRINRSETDFGATILIDERFKRFILQNKKALPPWLKKAIITG